MVMELFLSVVVFSKGIYINRDCRICFSIVVIDFVNIDVYLLIVYFCFLL